MKRIKIVLKGLLLYTTILSFLLFMMGVDSIYDNGYFFEWSLIEGILLLLCYRFIKTEDLEVLSFIK